MEIVSGMDREASAAGFYIQKSEDLASSAFSKFNFTERKSSMKPPGVPVI